MDSSGAAPNLPPRGLHELAALAEVQLTSDVHAAATLLLEQAQAWQQQPGWPWADTDRDVYAMVTKLGAALDRLGADAPLDVVLVVVRPILGAWVPDSPAAITPVKQAVEQLRYAAMWQPSLAANARGIVAAGLG